MTSRATSLLAASLLTLAGCSTAGADDPVDAGTIPVATEDPSSNPVDVGDTGDVDGEIGTPIGLMSGDESIFEITVHSIERAKTCPSRVDESEVTSTREFLIVDYTATMADNYGDVVEGEPLMVLAADAFQITNSDGVIQDASMSAESYECFSSDELIAPAIYSGETESGKIVLETDLATGYVVYNPWGVPGNGWRWKF